MRSAGCAGANLLPTVLSGRCQPSEAKTSGRSGCRCWHVIEAVLGHHGGFRSGVAGVYNKSAYEREMRAALVLWADHVHTLVEGTERKVLSFPPPPAPS